MAPIQTAGATVPSPSLFPVPATALPRLSTTGAFIADERGNAISLRGANIVGLDTLAAGYDLPSTLSLDEDNLSLMRDVWRLNLVRVPFRAATILSGTSSVAPADLLAALDSAISLVSEAGLYILLALEAPPASAATLGSAATAPLSSDADTIAAWQTLAARYSAQSAVLYEVFASAAPLDAGWPRQAQVLVGTIRRINPASLIFVGSGRGGADVSGLPMLFPTGEPVFNLVYTIDLSTSEAFAPDEGALSALAQSHPVFASVWSGGDDRLGPWIADLLGRYGIGWAAGNWNADPRLIVDAASHEFTSTSWGLVASRAAASPVLMLRRPSPDTNSPD